MQVTAPLGSDLAKGAKADWLAPIASTQLAGSVRVKMAEVALRRP